MSIAFPNFLIVGAAKSGTTSLYHYLNQHPEIYFPSIKEPSFFSLSNLDLQEIERRMYPTPLKEVVYKLKDYKNLFSDITDEKAYGEASVIYLLDHKSTIANIKKYIPNWEKLKIIIILRNPVDASFSHYQMMSQYVKNYIQDKNQKFYTFEEAIDVEQERLEQGYQVLPPFHWFYYYEQVKDYLDTFQNIKVYLNSDLRENSDELLRDIFDFLEVNKLFIPDIKNEKYNVSGVPKSSLLYKFLLHESFIRKMFRPMLRQLLSSDKKQQLIQKIWRSNMKKAAMNPETRKRVTEIYREDIVRLQKLLKRDLNSWFK